MNKKKLVNLLSDHTHICMGFEIGVNKNLTPGTMIVIPNKDDISINDLFIVTKLKEDGTNEIEPFKPIEPEINDDEYWSSLIMRMVQMSRQGRNNEYRDIKKEIKRLMLEDKTARVFFKTAFSSVKF